MRAVFAPGLDRSPPDGDRGNVSFRPGNGAGGVFAGFMQGATPKYAKNDGRGRPDLFRDTLARIFVRIDPDELETFRDSIADEHTKNRLFPRLVGGSTSPDGNLGPQSNVPDRSLQRARSVGGNGYLDFMIQAVQAPLQEKIQVTETLSDNYVLFAFGQSAPVWNFSGALINSVQDDQATNFLRLYLNVLRATQMARRQKSMSISFDSYVVNGVMGNLVLNFSSQNELVIPFSFQLTVKRVFITNYTAGWTPTTANSPFAADLNAVPFDGRTRSPQHLSRIAARTPAGTEEVTPVPQTREHPMVARANADETGVVPAASDSSTVQNIVAGTPISQTLAGPVTIPLRAPGQSVVNARPETVTPSTAANGGVPR